MKTSIKFINHASVIVSDDRTSLLSDPWYNGDAFHKGWNLLHETSDSEVNSLLDKITHIWISHEHPDHFSVVFFKTFREKIKNLSIKVLFQKTKDKRVLQFLKSLDIEVQELDFNEKIKLSHDYFITCIKDGFYDSGLLIESCGEKILNLNDCDIKSSKKADKVLSITGNVDVLLTQFSFAAWKGGEQNKRWRSEAANEKIEAIRLQVDKFKPTFVIPFASFIYFSNFENSYLNEAANKPDALEAKLMECSSRIVIMSPNDILGGECEALNQINAINFWTKKYHGIRPINRYVSVDMNNLIVSFEKYCLRIEKNNNMYLVRLIRLLSPIRAFKPVVVFLKDLQKSVKIDYVNKVFSETAEPPMLSMQSESLDFLFRNSFGFDTLTVNGCFEEKKKNGFVEATKTLAIENLNTLGFSINFRILLNFSIVKLFLLRLYDVALRLRA